MFELILIANEQPNFKVTEISGKTNNEVGKILYYPENKMYALLLCTTAAETSAMQATMLTDKTSENLMKDYNPLGYSNIQYIAKWIFYTGEMGELIPGVPQTVPPMLVDLSVLQTTTATSCVDFMTMVRIYAQNVVENGISDKHLQFLLKFPSSDEYLYNFVSQVLIRAIQKDDSSSIEVIDRLLYDLRADHCIQQMLPIAENIASVVGVEAGYIKTSHQKFPAVGDIYKFNIKNVPIYSAVIGVRYRNPAFYISNITRLLLSQGVLLNEVSNMPVATNMETGSGNELIDSVGQYPNYGQEAVPIDETDVAIIYPGEVVLGHVGQVPIKFGPPILHEHSVDCFGKSGSGQSDSGSNMSALIVNIIFCLIIYVCRNNAPSEGNVGSLCIWQCYLCSQLRAGREL